MWRHDYASIFQRIVNAIIEQEAPHLKKIISGTILVNDQRVYTLFDTGATHSSVSGIYVDRVTMMVEEAEETLVVALPSGARTSATVVCKRYEVLVSDMHIEIDLVVLSISDFDVILDMD